MAPVGGGDGPPAPSAASQGAGWVLAGSLRRALLRGCSLAAAAMAARSLVKGRVLVCAC